MSSQCHISILHFTKKDKTNKEFSRFLREKNIDIKTVYDIDKALKIIEDKEIDCILSSDDLQNKDLLKFLEKVKKYNPKLPSILYTTNKPEILKEEGSRYIDKYIDKSLEKGQFEVFEKYIKDCVIKYLSSIRNQKNGHINSVIRKINRILIRSDTQEELEKDICEIIASSDPYVFAWIGEYDKDLNEVKPRTYAGIEKDYLDKIEITADESVTGQGPTGKAIKTRKIQIVQNILENSEYEPWREEALERGYKSSIAIPLIYNDEFYGVLNVYSNRKYAFDKREKELLSEIGDDTAYEINAINNRKKLEKYKRIIENLPVGIYRNKPGSDGRFIEVNPKFCEIFDVDSKEEMLEHSARDFYINKKQRKNLSKKLEKKGKIEDEEIKNKTAKGEEIWISVTAMKSEENGEKFFDGIVRDITNQKRQKEKLETYKQAIDQAGTGIYITDKNGIIQYVNPTFEKLTGYDKHEAIGKKPNILKSGEQSENYYERLWYTILSGEIWEETIINQRKNGSLYYADQTIAPIKQNGEITQFVAIQKDITERRLENQRIQVLHRLLRHNLKNQLNFLDLKISEIQNDIEYEKYNNALLQVEKPIDKDILKIHRALAVIKNRKHCNLLEKSKQAIKDLEEISEKSLKAKNVLEIENKEITEIKINEILEGIKEEILDEKHNAKINIESSLDSIEVKTSIKPALEELIENGIKHNNSNTPKIDISVEKIQNNVIIKIKDNGLGIPDDELEVLKSNQETQLKHGTGLGLWIAYWTIEINNGTISFSDNKPKGTIAKIKLPKYPKNK